MDTLYFDVSRSLHAALQRWPSPSWASCLVSGDARRHWFQNPGSECFAFLAWPRSAQLVNMTSNNLLNSAEEIQVMLSVAKPNSSSQTFGFGTEAFLLRSRNQAWVPRRRRPTQQFWMHTSHNVTTKWNSSYWHYLNTIWGTGIPFKFALLGRKLF